VPKSPVDEIRRRRFASRRVCVGWPLKCSTLFTEIEYLKRSECRERLIRVLGGRGRRIDLGGGGGIKSVPELNEGGDSLQAMGLRSLNG